MRVKTTAVALALAALLLGLPASAAARTITVSPGESIQAAVDDAAPGTTIKLEKGTYHGTVVVQKDGIEIVGAGRKATKIDATATPPAECVICFHGEPNDPIEDVHVSRLTVTGAGNGVFFVMAKDISVKHVFAADNAEYGIVAFESNEIVFAKNVTPRNGEAGIYIGSSDDADALVWGNVSYGNVFGFFLRDASNGTVLKNKAFGNCAGFLFLETGDPHPAHNWLARKNHAVANNEGPQLCASNPEETVSGVGFAVAGAKNVHLIANGAFGNVPDPAVNSIVGGGIVLLSTAGPEGGADVTGAKIAFNTAFGNKPTDLFWDQKGQASFVGNDCETSNPDGLCDDKAPDGDHGDDDDADDDDRGNGGDHGNGGDRDYSKGRGDDQRGHEGRKQGSEAHKRGKKNLHARAHRKHDGDKRHSRRHDDD
jgi:hypothetical protein